MPSTLQITNNEQDN